MSMKALGLLYTLAFIFQLSIINIFSIFGDTPNLILCLTVALIFVYKSGYKALTIAIPMMVILDLVAAKYAGVGALTLFLTCIIVIIIRKGLNVENIFAMLTVSIISTIVYNLSYWGVLKILREPMIIENILIKIPFYIVYNMIITGVMFVFMRKHLVNEEKKRSYEE